MRRSGGATVTLRHAGVRGFERLGRWMMVRWWAAFFVLGLAFPAPFQAQLVASFVALGFLLCAWTKWNMQSPIEEAPGRSWFTKATSYCAITCSASIIIWGAAGIERTAHDVAVVRAAHDAGGSNRLQRANANLSSPQGDERIEFGLRSLSLWDERQRLLELLEDGRLSKRGRGIVGALVLDDRSGLDWRLSETYSYLGITHFLALSGMHLGVIAVPLSWIFSRIVRSRRLRDVLLFSVLCLYSASAGLPPSLMRSLALCAAVIGHGHFSVHSDLLSALVGGSFALVAIDPSVVFDAGFQLSFAAVAAIALIGVPLSRRTESILPGGFRGALLKTLVFPALITCSVQFFSLPLVIALFKRSSLLSPIVNVLVSLPFTVLLYAGVLYVFVPFWPLRALLSFPINAICRFLDDVPSLFSQSPHAAIYRGDFSAFLYIAGAALVAWGLKGSCENKRRAFVAGAVCIALSFVAPHAWRSVLMSRQHDVRGEKLTGQALSRTGSIYFPQGSGIIFVGEKFSTRQSYRLTRELWGRGDRAIARCIVIPSRLGRNYGLLYLLMRISVKEVIVSPYLLEADEGLRQRLAAKGIAVIAASAGDCIDAGFARVEIMGPVYPPAAGMTVVRAESRLRCRLVVASDGVSSAASGAFFFAPIDPDR